jgi:hypothetical protein
MGVIPLLVFVAGAYNLIVFLSPGLFTYELFKISLISGSIWAYTVTDLLLCVAVFLLFVEMYKSTRTGSSSIIDHMLSMLLFVGCLVEFLLLAPMGNSTFLLITLLTLLDVVAGFTITISSARRDMRFS